MSTPAWSGTVATRVGASELPRGHWLYVIKSHDAVLYVGQAAEPYRRLNQHLMPPGCIVWHASALNDLAHDYWDDAQGWTIDVYEASADLDQDEARLIRRLRPCLNTQHNPRRRRLPKR